MLSHTLSNCITTPLQSKNSIAITITITQEAKTRTVCARRSVRSSFGCCSVVSPRRLRGPIISVEVCDGLRPRSVSDHDALISLDESAHGENVEDERWWTEHRAPSAELPRRRLPRENGVPFDAHATMAGQAVAASGSDSAEVNGMVCSLLDRGNKTQVCLFYCPETEDLARRIATETDSIELRSITWGCFADGFPNLFVPNAPGIRSQHVAFLASFSSPGVIFEQLSIIYALPRMFVASFTLVLPFFPTGTLERMEDEGDIATAFTLAKILSNIPISRGGPTSLVIFDIHALQERFYFGDNVLPCFESGIPLLKHRLHQLPDAKNVTIAFPDEGAWKRFYKLLQHFPTIICTKVREGDNRIVKLKEGDPSGRHVVIVDDLVQSGSTLIECQKLLEGLGASKVSAYATHGVFPKRSWERFVRTENAPQGFEHFWISDSCPLTVKEVMGKAPFEILSLAGSIAASLHI